MCQNYDQYISAIKDILVNDLYNAFPEVQFREGSSVVEDLRKIFDCKGIQFVFVLDEWDAVFHMSFIGEENRVRYLLFLRNLLKDQAYVALAYMTGILPIDKYSSGSELNMFLEYTMALEERFSKYFVFLQNEVDGLYRRYLKLESNPRIALEDLGKWYDGYHTFAGDRVYNPRSVVVALTNNNLGNYWTSAGPYDEIFYYIKNNVNGVKDDLARMITGETVVLLSQQNPDDRIRVKVDLDELDETSVEAKATYKKITDWVQEHYGFHVTNLNIAQVKRKNGIIERDNYNKPKSENSRQPGTTPEKEKAISKALKYFKMIKGIE